MPGPCLLSITNAGLSKGIAQGVYGLIACLLNYVKYQF